MKRIALIALVAVAVTALVSCGAFDPDTSSAVLVRVENTSATDFSSVSVSFPGAAAEFGYVHSGEMSEYQEVETAYRYGAFAVEIEDMVLRTLPIDYVGEKPLEHGRYTFSLNRESARLIVAVRQD